MARKIKIAFQIILSVLIVALLAMLVTGCMILFRGFGSKDPFTYMIVLGTKVEGTEPSPMLSDRINAAAKYMEENPHVIAIATGLATGAAGAGVLRVLGRPDAPFVR